MVSPEAEMEQAESEKTMAGGSNAPGGEEEESYSVRNECSGEVLERVRAMQWLASVLIALVGQTHTFLNT
jgi:hypothetical protein